MKTIVNLSIFTMMFLLLCSCRKEETRQSYKSIHLNLRNVEYYQHEFMIPSDDEAATIITQAKHFEMSEIIRDASTNWRVIYIYKADSNYVGKDFVEIETSVGGHGSASSKKELMKFYFTISE